MFASQFFDGQGNRIHKNGENGCPRPASACNFIHPSDPEWNTVLPDSSPMLVPRDNWRPPHEGSSRRSPVPSTSYRSRERRQSSSSDHQHDAFDGRRRTPPRGSSAHRRSRSPVWYPRSPDSPPRRHGFSTISRDGPPLTRRSPSHERPSSFKRPHPPAPDPKSVSKPPPLLMRLGDRVSGSGKETMALPVGSVKAAAVPVPTASTAPKTPSASGKVLSRPVSEVLPPPPSINPAPLKDDMTPDQRRAVWEKRVALMADATQEYMDLGKLEKDVESRRRQVQSAAFNTLPSGIKDAFQTGLQNALASYERKKVSLNSAISKLSETDFWPSVPSHKLGDMEAKLKEAKTMLGGLADIVGQLYKRIDGQRPGRRVASPSGADEGATAAGDGDTRAKKRRRLSSVEGGDNSVDTTSPDVREDVESIRDTIREIEDRLQEVENDMTQHSRDILERLEVKVDEKIEEMTRSADVPALVEVQLGPQTTQTIRAFNESFAQADREIAELAQEMADLIPQLDELRRDNDLSKQEEVVDKELLAQLVKADQDNGEAIARLQEEARTLRVALAAQTKRALPPTPALPLSGPFMEAIKGSIATQVQEHILPIVAQTRGEIERIAKTRDAELYEKLRDKLDQSSKMSQLISTWIERNPDDARQALAAAAARAQGGVAGSSESVLT